MVQRISCAEGDHWRRRLFIVLNRHCKHPKRTLKLNSRNLLPTRIKIVTVDSKNPPTAQIKHNKSTSNEKFEQNQDDWESFNEPSRRNGRICLLRRWHRPSRVSSGTRGTCGWPYRAAGRSNRPVSAAPSAADSPESSPIVNFTFVIR